MNQNKFSNDINEFLENTISKSTIDSLSLLQPIYDRLVEQEDSIKKEAEKLIDTFQDEKNTVATRFRKQTTDSIIKENDFINSDKFCKLFFECAGSNIDLDSYIKNKSKVLYSPIKDSIRKKFAKKAHKKYGVSEYSILTGNGGNIFDETLYKLKNGITQEQSYQIEVIVMKKIADYAKKTYGPELSKIRKLLAVYKPIVSDLKQRVVSAQIGAILYGVSNTETVKNALDY